MCGIFGFISNKIENIDANAFRLLGVLNETRGTDSCGVVIDSDIFHGTTYQDKKFRDFAKGISLKPESKPVLIGHTRKSSVGLTNTHNAHPFGFGTNKKDGGYAFLGAHNGTLYNYEELASHFDIERSERINGLVRHKIDSEILLESIYATKSFKPLSFYNGGAALVWYTPDNDTVYLFSGESKSYEVSQSTSIERPLHVWVIDDNTFAFSSEKEPLEVIGAVEKEVFQIDTNTVYIIKDGDFKNAHKVKISRNNSLSRRIVETNYAHNTRRLPQEASAHVGRSYSGHNSASTKEDSKTNMSSTEENTRTLTLFDDNGLCIPQRPVALSQGCGTVKKLDNKNEDSMYSLSPNDYKGRLYVRNLKYFRNGHVAISGIYHYVPRYGLVYAGTTLLEVNTMFTRNKECYFDTGTGNILSKTEYDKIDKTYNYERYYKMPSHVKTDALYYIYEGYMLKTITDYYSTLNNPSFYKNVANQTYHMVNLSHITKYPVLSETIPFYKRYIQDGQLVSTPDKVFGVNFDNMVTIEDGNVTDYTILSKPHLIGLDMYNLDNYRSELSKYHKEVAEHKSKKVDMVELLNFLEASFDEKPVLTKDTKKSYYESIMNDIVDDVIEHYYNYENECYMVRNDVGIVTYLDDVKITCRSYNTTLAESVFEIVEVLQQRRRKLENDAKMKATMNTLSAIITVLLNYEKQFN